MVSTTVYALVSVLIVSLLSLIGLITLSFNDKLLKNILLYLVSFAAGGLLGDSFVHLLPEAVEKIGFSVMLSFYVLLGIVVSFVIEKVIQWRHCHHEEHIHPFAVMNLFGDGVHNFIDGLIIGGSYLVSIPLGIATTIAVIFHEIPQEVGDFGVLLQGGFSKAKALFFNFISASLAIIGTIVALLLNVYIEKLDLFLVPFAAGSFIYIAASDLIPELHKETNVWRSLMQLLFFILGLAIMFGLLYFD